jgi:sulfoxide reductase heme-binding subunit YedZ
VRVAHDYGLSSTVQEQASLAAPKRTRQHLRGGMPKVAAQLRISHAAGQRPDYAFGEFGRVCPRAAPSAACADAGSHRTQSAPRRHRPPHIGADGDQRRRVLFHHVPIALASAVALALFTGLPIFNAPAFPHPDIVSGVFPKAPIEGGATGHAGSHTGTAEKDRGLHEPMSHGAQHGATEREPTAHSGEDTEGSHGAQFTRHGGRMGGGRRPVAAGRTRPGGHRGDARSDGTDADVALTRSLQRLTVATGYLGLGLLAVTLLLGPANLVLRRRNPASSYLRRDVGIWTAIFSIAHVVCAVLAHVGPGTGVIAAFVHFFVARDGRVLTNSFGLGNWTGLAATVIVVALLATSSDAALRKLKARPWKWLQRFNYALFALVILHAFFYGALLRITSPFTQLLILSAIAVSIGQAVGVWFWRRRYFGFTKYSGVAIFVALVCGVAMANVGAFAQSGEPPRPDFSGRWQLNADLSENAQAKVDRMQKSQGHGPGRHGLGFLGRLFGGGDVEAARDLILNVPVVVHAGAGWRPHRLHGRRWSRENAHRERAQGEGQRP